MSVKDVCEMNLRARILRMRESLDFADKFLSKGDYEQVVKRIKDCNPSTIFSEFETDVHICASHEDEDEDG